MELCPYVSYKGDCEAAFRLYESALGGRMGALFRYAGTSLVDQVPSDWQDKVMHGSITIGGQVLMGADIAPDRYEAPKGVTLSLQLGDVLEAKRTFGALAENGRIVMPLEETFWATSFGVVTDPYGVTWTINCGEHEPRADD